MMTKQAFLKHAKKHGITFQNLDWEESVENNSFEFWSVFKTFAEAEKRITQVEATFPNFVAYSVDFHPNLIGVVFKIHPLDQLFRKTA